MLEYIRAACSLSLSVCFFHSLFFFVSLFPPLRKVDYSHSSSFSLPSCLSNMHFHLSFFILAISSPPFLSFSFPFSTNLPFFVASFPPPAHLVCFFFSSPPSYIKFCILSSSLPLVPIDSPPSWVLSPLLYAFSVCCLHTLPY